VGRTSWDFRAQLASYGPVGTLARQPVSLYEAEVYCQQVASRHYENFQIASWFLPRLLRQDFYNIYAYCRWSDDCADEACDRTEATALLSWWQSELDALFRGEPPSHPVMCALSSTIARHGLPKKPFADLLSAFRQDQLQTRYETLEELNEYCRRSASPVGRLLLGLAQATDDRENLRLSDAICTGLQLANFCQDMARDAALGRIYVPREIWRCHDVDEAMILAARATPQLQAMLARFVAHAREPLTAGAPLAARLPAWLSLDVDLFRAGGLAILDQIERVEFDVWTRRPTVSKFRKLQLLLRCYVASLARKR
jgi:squalene synthase HpnC